MAEKRQSVKKINGEKLAAGIYEASFTNGTVVTVDSAEFSDEVKHKLFLYGLKQKLDDAMALDAGSPVEDYIDELTSTVEALKKGQWTMRVAGEGVEGGLFARAYAQRHGLSLADAKGKISALVERNLKANQEAYAGDAKVLEKITERSIFNRLRDAAIERDAELKRVYQELKDKRAAKKAESAEMEITTEL